MLASALFFGLSRRLVQKGILSAAEVRMLLEETQHLVEETFDRSDPLAEEVHFALENLIQVLVRAQPKSPPSAE
jgi:argininosuccinate lyase